MTGMDEDQFDRIWKRKLQSGQSSAYVPGENLRIDKTLSFLPNGRRILDIGCGAGIMLTCLKGQFEDLHGIDISREAVNAAFQNGIHAKALDLNSSPLPYEDGYFNVVTILSSLQYFGDPCKVLRECNRVISSGGLLLLSVPNMRAFWRIGKLLFLGTFPRVSLDPEGYDGGTLHYFTYSDLKELLSKNGFRISQTDGVFCIPHFVTYIGNKGFVGSIKREFFSAETFVLAVKV